MTVICSEKIHVCPYCGQFSTDQVVELDRHLFTCDMNPANGTCSTCRFYSAEPMVAGKRICQKPTVSAVFEWNCQKWEIA